MKYILFISLIFIFPIYLLGQNNNEEGIYIKDKDTCIFFKFTPKYTVNRGDKEKYKPKSFKINLPNKIKYWEAISGANFGFYYKSKQVIFINTDLYNYSNNKSDSIYTPSKKEIKSLITTTFETSRKRRRNIEEIPFIKGRKFQIVKKQGVTILLYNIKTKNFNNYLDLVKTFTELQ